MNSGRKERFGEPRPRLVRALRWTSLIMLLLSLWALSARCGRRACAWMILPAALLAVLGFTLRDGLLGGAFRLVSMLPLLLFLLLCVIHVCLWPRKKPGPERRPGPGPLRDGRPVR